MRSLNEVSLLDEDQGRDNDGECDECKYVENNCDENMSSLGFQDIHRNGDQNSEQVENSQIDRLRPATENHMQLPKPSYNSCCLCIIFSCIFFSLCRFQFDSKTMPIIKRLTSDTIDKSTSAMVDLRKMRELSLRFYPDYSIGGALF